MITVNTIELIRENWKGKASLGILNTASFRSFTDKEECLHEQELVYSRNLRYEKRRYSYLAGRYIAKKSLGQFLGTDLLSKILIQPGVFNQPIVTATISNPPSISISHTEEVAACVVFPREHPMGLDAETVKEYKAEAIETQLTLHEKQLFPQKSFDKVHFYTYLWTAKEALSKLLTTGLMTPLEVYQIETISLCGNYAVSTFSNFEQYQAVTFLQDNTVFSLVLPKNTQYTIV